MQKLRKPMTRQGHFRLSEEYDHLVKEVRPRVVQGIADAAAEGDRSENAEYIYGKKRLRELDKRIRYLDKLLDHVQIIDAENLSGNRVAFASTVFVVDEHGEQRQWTIVGEGEAEHDLGQISWKSPVAKALMGKRVGDVVEVLRPAGYWELEIIGLQFAGVDYQQKT